MIGWMLDGRTRLWLVENGAQLPYYMMRQPAEIGVAWALYSVRRVEDKWPELGQLVVSFPTRHALERWIAASELP